MIFIFRNAFILYMHPDGHSGVFFQSTAAHSLTDACAPNRTQPSGVSLVEETPCGGRTRAFPKASMQGQVWFTASGVNQD